MRLKPFVFWVVASISSSLCAETQGCSIERKRVFPAASDGLRLLPHGVTLFHARPPGSAPVAAVIRKQVPALQTGMLVLT